MSKLHQELQLSRSPRTAASTTRCTPYSIVADVGRARRRPHEMLGAGSPTAVAAYPHARPSERGHHRDLTSHAITPQPPNGRGDPLRSNPPRSLHFEVADPRVKAVTTCSASNVSGEPSGTPRSTSLVPHGHRTPSRRSSVRPPLRGLQRRSSSRNRGVAARLQTPSTRHPSFPSRRDDSVKKSIPRSPA